MNELSSAIITEWIAASASEIGRERETLTRLDAIVGDGDHAVNLLRGFSAAADAATEVLDNPPEDVLSVVGSTISARTGGASGALWGVAFADASTALREASPTLNSVVARMFRAMSNAIADLGGAAAGDKTMLDALLPASRAIDAAYAAGKPLVDALVAGSVAASEGAEATRSMEAKFGRASYRADKGVGNPDAGAVSAAMVVSCLARVLAQHQAVVAGDSS
jgi:dihydroxyacetone kinase-like protein